MSKNLSILRVGFFLDGYTLKKVNEYYLKYHRYHARLDFRELKGWVRDFSMRLFGREGCPIEIESHYYHPYVRNADSADLSMGDGMERFERQLALAGFEVHYNTPGDVNRMGPNMQLVEDAYLYAYYHKIDVLVLLSTQGQYSTLPERLKREGVPMLLLGWNFNYEKDNTTVYWRTDSCLRELSGYYVAMEEVAEKYPPRRCAARNLFLLPFGLHPAHISKSRAWSNYLRQIIESVDSSQVGCEKNGYEKSPAVAGLG